MKILVTGGAGFIGSNFIRYWLEHHPADSLVNFDKLTYAGHLSTLKDFENNPRHRFFEGDIQNPDAIANAAEKGIDAIVHFAAESHVDRSIYGPIDFVRTNVLGTTHLLEWTRQHPQTRFVLVSTDEVYGSLSLEDRSKKFKWGDPYQPRNPYAASKASADHLSRAYHHTYGLDIMITNCTNNVGPYQDPEKFVPLSITNLLEDKPIRIYGDGKYIRDWLWVDDHIMGIEKVLLKGKRGETYLFGGKSEIDNLSLAKRILAKLKKQESAIEFVSDRPGNDRRYAMDYSKTLKELDWQPTLGIDEILDKTIAWYQENSWWWKPIKGRKEGVVITHG